VSQIKLSKEFIRSTVKLALNEDLYPLGDITSGLIENNKLVTVKLLSNQNALIGGLLFAKQAFELIDGKIKFIVKKKDGSKVKKGSLIAIIKGKAKNILIAERVALNFLSHISGIATKTNQFVKLAGKKTKICCTRKTIPNLRVIQKYAVKLGGGTNHRFNLSDQFLIKDNHVASSDLKSLVLKAIKNKKGKKITVEVDNVKQLKSILGLKFNAVLLDNMNIKSLKESVKIAKKYYETEASGNINLKNIKAVASTGVNRISIGSITHSATAIDFKLEI
jgi:nicotinate-nucleotide pyrophosphorylase (carboxylating)